jgi:hypothetical protein
MLVGCLFLTIITGHLHAMGADCPEERIPVEECGQYPNHSKERWNNYGKAEVDNRVFAASKISASQPHPDSNTPSGNNQPDWQNIGWWISDPSRILAVLTIALVWINMCQARAVSRTVRTMEGTERTQLRAYVGIDKLEIDSPHLTSAHYQKPKLAAGSIYQDVFILHVKNFGQTPASTVTAHINWDPRKWPENLPRDFLYLDQFSQIDPGVENITNLIYIDHEQTIRMLVPIDDMTHFRRAHKKEVRLYVYGHISYADIYKRRWRRKFCYVYEPWAPKGRDIMVTYGDYNYEEELK